MIQRCLKILLPAVLFVPTGCLASDPDVAINKIINMTSPPSGVVFEVASGKENSLQWALPIIRTYSQQLRQRFAHLDIAVVSHGKEEFALLSANEQKYRDVHQAVQQLTTEDQIPVHVCGTHASWKDKTPEDFPAYVDVAPAGPTQIQDYQNLGYHLVVIRKPKQ